MKTAFIVAALIGACCIPSAASAVPLMWYDAVSGNIYFHNDHTGPLANLSVISSSGSLRDTSYLRDLPGAIKDDSELPFAFTYLGLPVGLTYAGAIVQPGTPIGDLRFEYRLNSLLEPVKQGVGPSLLIEFPFPEPASSTLAVMSAFAFVGAARPARGRRGVG